MALHSGFSPKVLLLLLVASCLLRETQSRPVGRSSRHAWPSEESIGVDGVAPGAIKAAAETPVDASPATADHEFTPAKDTLLSRQRRQGPDDPPPVPPDPPIQPPPDPPIPSSDSGGGVSINFDPFSFFDVFSGPPRRYGGSDPITSFFAGIESFKRDLTNFFFG